VMTIKGMIIIFLSQLHALAELKLFYWYEAGLLLGNCFGSLAEIYHLIVILSDCCYLFCTVVVVHLWGCSCVLWCCSCERLRVLRAGKDLRTGSRPLRYLIQKLCRTLKSLTINLMLCLLYLQLLLLLLKHLKEK
jgi:hypothetical protein